MKRMKDGDIVVLADADNTLWDTDAKFAQAQLRLLERIEAAVGIGNEAQDRLAFVRVYDQALASGHHLHLRYPPGMLVRALAAGLAAVEPETAAKAVLGGHSIGPALSPSDEAAVLLEYRAVLSETPELLPGVRDGLMRATREGFLVYVLTEGPAEKQRNIMRAHGLASVISGVSEGTKNSAQFSRLRRRFSPATVIVVGDQPDRDIVPARQADCEAILIPSRFRPHWHESYTSHGATHVAANFDEAIDWIAEKYDR